MPKKFVGENSKAAAARARKAQASEEKEAIKKKQIEDELWKDDDKHVQRKQQRKESKEKKKMEQLEKKQEKKSILEQEIKSIKTTGKEPLAKITQAQIQAENEKRAAALSKLSSSKNVQTHVNVPLEENINHLQVEGAEARTIDEAISVLSLKETPVDKHPERRLKAAYAAFEEANMARIKAEHPTLRLSQLKQVLFKEWSKSPENPLNQTS
ncbi:unnamed protein product [Bemisia tabaci]|uniref:Coiled-coil domain-containing protein n=1 Tax=Bemisia tabaci TaxID=7038 RepID=A0A9N9ZZ15_BEMTA|nr:unnamed protein product [Bemisia tabaci]